MGKYRTEDYYDGVYIASPKYKLHWSESEYLLLWEEVIKLIPHKNVFITDLGCGVGQFGEMLKDRGYHNYVGYDYSEVAIKMASNKGIKALEADVLKPFIITPFIIALEIFEHTDDIKILENIPKGITIIFSVPDFNDPAHIRHFVTIDKVKERYNKYIAFESLEKYNKWYLGKGVKK